MMYLLSLSVNDIIRYLPVKNLFLMVSFKFRERTLKKKKVTPRRVMRGSSKATELLGGGGDARKQLAGGRRRPLDTAFGPGTSLAHTFSVSNGEVTCIF